MTEGDIVKKAEISVDVPFQVEFYDVDSMNVAWHGRYVNFLEIGRRALLDKIGYGYLEMNDSGYLWPVVDMRIKYVKPLLFGHRARVKARLVEWENRLKIKFEIVDDETGEILTRAETTQMAVDAGTGESLFVSPSCLTDAVAAMESALHDS